MKTKYIASNKRHFTLHFMWGIGFYYQREIFHYDKYSCVENVSYYFLCFKVNAIQHFRKFDI